MIHMVDATRHSSNRYMIFLSMRTTWSIRGWPFLLSTRPKLGLSVEEEMKGGEYEVAAKKGLAYAPLVSSYL